MNCRKTDRISKLDLGDGKVDLTLLRGSNCRLTGMYFAEEMRDPLLSRSSTHIDDPLTQDRLINEACHQQALGYHGMIFQKVEDRLAGNVDHLAFRQRCDTVIHAVEKRHMQVAEITLDQKGEDLPLASLDHLIAAGQTAEDQMHIFGSVVLTDDILLGGIGFRPHDDLVQKTSVIVA